MDINDKNHGSLARVLEMAYEQAASGKGVERHGHGIPFHQQPMLEISSLLGNPDGMAYQVCKKVIESRKLTTKEARVRELLGVIVYAAGMVIWEDIDLMNITSLTLDLDNISKDDLQRIEQAIARENADISVPNPMPTRTGSPRDGLPTDSKALAYNLVRCHWAKSKTSRGRIRVATNPSPTTEVDENYAKQAAHLAAILAIRYKDAEVIIDLRNGDRDLSNYRSFIIGEILQYDGVDIKDGPGDWTQVKVVYIPQKEGD